MTFPWTDKHKARMAELWRAGRSAKEIAKVLDANGKLTRNMIIGMLWRAGLRRDKKPAAPVVRKPARSKPVATVKPRTELHHKPSSSSSRGARFLRTTQTVDDPIVRAFCFKPIEDVPTVGIMDLKNGMCRWPLGEGPVRYCGEPTSNPSCSYCAGHGRLAFTGSVVDAPEMAEAA